MEPIDRIAILLPNCTEAVEVFLACFKGGFVIVPLDYRHRAAQIRYALNHSGADVLIFHHDRLAELEEEDFMNRLSHIIVVGGDPLQHRQVRYENFVSSGFSADYSVDYRDDDLCSMIFTSGTTSRPKGVTLTRKAMELGIKKYLARVDLSQDDVALIAAPITRPMALRCQLLPMLHVGGYVSLMAGFSVDGFIEAMQRPPAKTFLSSLPAGLSQVVAHPEFSQCDFSALRLCICGGDRVPLYLHEQFAKTTGVPITEQCGASEVGPYALNPPYGRKKPGSIGLPMYGSQVCVIDDQGDDATTNQVGEITVFSPMMMDGYWNDTALTRKTMRNGWIYTGDLGKFDEDGYLWFMGRKKDVIIRGGSNVSPHEIESVLLDHSDVAQACVIGMLDETWGQVPVAFVVCHDEERQPTEEALLSLCRDRLAEYMVPAAIETIDRMPLKGPGKINRDLLRIRGEIRRLIDKVPFFQQIVSKEFIQDMSLFLEIKDYTSEQWIFRQGEMGDAMYFLTRGKVEVVREDTGKVIDTLNEGAYFGELAVLRASARAASIRALGDCEVLELKRAGVRELAQKYPLFDHHINEACKHYAEI